MQKLKRTQRWVRRKEELGLSSIRWFLVLYLITALKKVNNNPHFNMCIRNENSVDSLEENTMLSLEDGRVVTESAEMTVVY